MIILNFAPSVRFTQKLAPMAFKNALIYNLYITIIEHFVFNTLFEFCQEDAICNLTNPNNEPLNSFINVLEINSYNARLGKSVLDPAVFEALQSLTSVGHIRSIDIDLFLASFKQLNYLLIATQSLRNFFHRVGMDWSQYLNNFNNYSCQTNDSNLINTFYFDLGFENTVSNHQANPEYQFPDSDFCIFVKLPVDKLVLMQISYDVQNCSCLYFWLVHNYPYFIQSFLHTDQVANAEQYNSSYLKCSVKGEAFTQQCLNKSEEIKYLCNLNRTQILQTFYTEQELENYDITYTFYTARYFVSVVLIPMFSIFVFFLNALIIYVTRAQAKELKESFFDYMKLNSWFNCMYCALFLTNLMSVCILSMGIYCSSIQTSIFVQYWKIVVIEYFADAIKTCASVTYILMNVSRYMLIGRDHNKTLQFISELKPKTVNIFLFLFSGLLSLVKSFQYQVNYHKDNFDYPIIIDPKNSGGLTLAKAVNTIFSFLHDFVNSFLFCILSLIIEAVIVKKLKKELNDKDERIASMTDSSTRQQNVTLSARIRHRKKQNESTKVEQKAILMTSVNSFLNFTFRLPEMFIPVYFITETFYSNSSWLQYLCGYLSICEILNDMISLLFIISLSVNYFVYYYFNKKFKEAVYVTLPVWVSSHLTLPRDSSIKPAVANTRF
jgi:hypothetical protein